MSAAILASAMLLRAGEPSSAAPPLLTGSNTSVWLLEAKGRVDVLHASSRLPARPNQALVPADRVQTWTNSHANLLWYDRLLFQVSELSDILIPRPPGSAGRSTLDVLKGFIYFFHRGEPREIEIRTPTAAAIVVGTEFSVRVEPNGRTVLMLFDGTLEVANPQGQARVAGGEQAIIEPGLAPVVTPILEGVNDLIQWFLYYPGVLNADELELDAGARLALADSLGAYRRGDLREALARHPAGRAPASDSERLYLAALLLSVGQVDKAETQLNAVAVGAADRGLAVAGALRKVVAAVKGRVDPGPVDPRLATSWLAESYYRQARGDLRGSRAAALQAVARAPEFGFAQARLAELEFSLGAAGPALAAIEKALAASPDHAQALALKGFLLSGWNRVHEAIDLFDQALARDGGLGNAWLGRGLCRVRQGDRDGGRQDLLIAAAVEPQRSLLRCYLGKVLADAGERGKALHELQLARRLDPNDPTAPFYAALLGQQENRINEAVRDLQQSQALNDRRRLYRSGLLLDQDRAVRGANLAAIYRDAGLEEVGRREAIRAVNSDYANYSAHLFLANAYDQLRDPRQVELRYEAPWLSEYLLATLLAPVGAGALSPTVSQQEYSRLLERDRLGFVSSTDYGSAGDWQQSAAQYGISGNLSYLLETSHRTRRGERANHDQEQLSVSLQLKQQLSAKDTVLLQPLYYSAEGGDLTQYHDPGQASRGARFRETQEPQLVAGYHREWSVSQHTLLVAGRLQDTFTWHNPQEVLLLLNRQGPAVVRTGFTTTTNDYRHEITGYFTEGQHLWKTRAQTLVLGARYHQGDFETTERYGDAIPVFLNAISFFPPGTNSRVHTRFERAGAYAYDFLHLTDRLLLAAGVTYDWVRFPENWRSIPISTSERSTDQLSPKAGLTWQPAARTILRSAYTRSLGGVSLDQSHRLEPTQVGGFNQAYRSLIPESVAGNVPVPAFETFGAGAEQQVGRGTYLGLEAELLRSDADQKLGATEASYSPVFPFPRSYAPGSLRRTLDFEERVLRLTINQLIGDEWSIGARYGWHETELVTRFPGTPAAALSAPFSPRITQAAQLHEVNLLALFNHPSGFFAEGLARWYVQDNRADDAGLADAHLWQFDLFIGHRLPGRRAEARLGLLNLTDRDYRLNPLQTVGELPRRRTLTASLKFNF